MQTNLLCQMTYDSLLDCLVIHTDCFSYSTVTVLVQARNARMQSGKGQANDLVSGLLMGTQTHWHTGTPAQRHTGTGTGTDTALAQSLPQTLALLLLDYAVLIRWQSAALDKWWCAGLLLCH